MALVRTAVNMLDDAPIFEGALVRGLDPNGPGGLGVKAFEQIASFGDLVRDENTQRAQQWGGLALLGALAMTYDQRLHGSPPPATESDQALYRAQLAGTVARETLLGLLDADIGRDRRSVIGAFLSHSPMPSEDLAIEFSLLGLAGNHTAKESVQEPTTTTETRAELSDTGVRIDQKPYQVTLLPLSPDAQDKIIRMDWSTLDIEAITRTPFEGRTIYHDGKEVACVVDLTKLHPKLQALKEDLEQHDKVGGEQFWQLLANGVVRQITDRRGKRILSGKTPTFYTGNVGRSEHIVRAYFTPLGTLLDDKQIIGLTAACRTKANELDVLKIISTNTSLPKRYTDG